jgi:alpha-2-macroglobulin
LALDAYRRVREAKAPNFVARAWFGERSLVTLEARQRSTAAVTGSATMAELLKAPGGLLSFEKDGSGTLHYEARLKYAPRDLPSTALDLGFFVRKTQRRVDPSELTGLRAAIPDRSEERFAAGDLVLTDLVVVAPGAREYVVIDDPLPAGFEAVDSSLATNVLPPPLRTPNHSECEECEVEPGDASLGGAQAHAYLSLRHRQEIRDDRVLYFLDHMPAGMTRFRYLSRATSAGRFVLPPTRAEAMYEPEIFGRTAASVLEVR